MIKLLCNVCCLQLRMSGRMPPGDMSSAGDGCSNKEHLLSEEQLLSEDTIFFHNLEKDKALLLHQPDLYTKVKSRACSAVGTRKTQCDVGGAALGNSMAEDGHSKLSGNSQKTQCDVDGAALGHSMAEDGHSKLSGNSQKTQCDVDGAALGNSMTEDGHSKLSGNSQKTQCDVDGAALGNSMAEDGHSKLSGNSQKTQCDVDGAALGHSMAEDGHSKLSGNSQKQGQGLIGCVDDSCCGDLSNADLFVTLASVGGSELQTTFTGDESAAHYVACDTLSDPNQPLPLSTAVEMCRRGKKKSAAYKSRSTHASAALPQDNREDGEDTGRHVAEKNRVRDGETLSEDFDFYASASEQCFLDDWECRKDVKTTDIQHDVILDQVTSHQVIDVSPCDGCQSLVCRHFEGSLDTSKTTSYLKNNNHSQTFTCNAISLKSVMATSHLENIAPTTDITTLLGNNTTLTISDTILTMSNTTDKIDNTIILKGNTAITTSCTTIKMSNTAHTLSNTTHTLSNTTHTLSNTTHAPDNTTHTLSNTTHTLSNTTHTPDNTTHTLSNTTHTLSNTTHTLSNTTHAPDNTTHTPDNTTHAPDNTTHAPDNTTHTPDNTTHAPDNTTHAPDNATHTPDNTTHTPDNTTHTPDNTTHTPDNTTHTPDNTTHTPDNTTHTPDNTTLTPDNTALTPDSSALTTDITTLTPDSSALTTDITTLTLDITALTPDSSALTPDSSALTLDITTLTPDSSALDTDIKPCGSVTENQRSMMTDCNTLGSDSNVTISDVSMTTNCVFETACDSTLSSCDGNVGEAGVTGVSTNVDVDDCGGEGGAPTIFRSMLDSVMVTGAVMTSATAGHVMAIHDNNSSALNCDGQEVGGRSLAKRLTQTCRALSAECRHDTVIAKQQASVRIDMHTLTITCTVLLSRLPCRRPAGWPASQ